MYIVVDKFYSTDETYGLVLIHNVFLLMRKFDKQIVYFLNDTLCTIASLSRDCTKF